MGVKEMRSIIDDETRVYWTGFNAACEAVAKKIENELPNKSTKMTVSRAADLARECQMNFNV